LLSTTEERAHLVEFLPSLSISPLCCLFTPKLFIHGTKKAQIVLIDCFLRALHQL
jgi:hypothetical protein